MVKRDKRLKKSIETFKQEIENHFQKLDKDILENDEITARYHIKEIDKSLIASLEKKITQLGEDNPENRVLISNFRKKLEEYKIKIGIEE